MSTTLVNTIGLTLAHFLWEGAAIALLLVLFVRAGARLRYAAACPAILPIPVPCVVTLFVLRAAPSPAAMAIALRLGDVPALRAGGPIATSVSFSIWRWAVPGWMVGVAVFYLRAAGGWIAARRLRYAGTRTASADWQERFATLCARMRVDRAVTLVESCLTEVPVVIGYLKPVVLLPAGLVTGLSTEQVEALLVHELAHIRRHDYLVNMLQSVVEGLLFY